MDSGFAVVVVLDHGVRAREEQSLLTAVLPPHEVRGCAVDAPDVQYLTIAVRFTDPMTPNHDPITLVGLHGFLLSTFIVRVGAIRRQGRTTPTSGRDDL
jgi:hypothetical protein